MATEDGVKIPVKIEGNAPSGDDVAEAEHGAAAPVPQDEEREAQVLREQIRRMQADFENYKRRQEQAKEDMKHFAKEDILQALLPVIDNLERALNSTRESRNFDALQEGIGLVFRSFRELLAKEGLVEVATVGSAFDPAVHQAISREERDDVEDETVTEEFQKGYLLGGRLLRPALIKVARHPGQQ